MALRSAPVTFGSMRARPPLAFAGQRIGLLGGSFNPPHDAHVMISKEALRRLGLDAVWWIITPGNPLKDHGALLPQDQRQDLCRRIIDDPRVIPTTFEGDLPSAYTAATLEFLKRRNNGVRFVWLMGADNLAGFHRWQRWREIAAHFPICVIDRPTYRLRAVASKAAIAMRNAYVPERRARILASFEPPAWSVLTVRLSELSSTALRESGTPPFDKPRAVDDVIIP